MSNEEQASQTNLFVAASIEKKQRPAYVEREEISFGRSVINGGLLAGAIHLGIMFEAQAGKLRHVLVSSLAGAGLMAIGLVVEKAYKQRHREDGQSNTVTPILNVSPAAQTHATMIDNRHAARLMQERMQASLDSSRAK